MDMGKSAFATEDCERIVNQRNLKKSNATLGTKIFKKISTCVAKMKNLVINVGHGHGRKKLVQP